MSLSLVCSGFAGSPAALGQSAPPNDDCDGATVIGAVPFTDTVDTTAATVAVDEPTDCDGGFGPLPSSVWYRFTPAVGVYTGSRGSLTQVSCFSEGAGLIAEAGVTYYIRVADYFGQGGGSLVFSARRGATVDALTIDGTGLLDRASGSITVSGSVTCSEPATVVVSIGIEQRRGQGVAEAEVPCSDTPSTWSVTVPPFSGRFVPGRAQVSAQAGLCSLLVCDIEEARASIQMRA
ncbi:MAG: hypothetical protein ACRDMW_01290 [Gaiellaceae bacterium]